MKGMLVWTYRSNHDCTNGGVTSKHDRFILCGAGVPEIFDASYESDETPALRLVRGNGHMFARPELHNDKEYTGWMWGGNFVYSSDSRFPCQYPIPVHDRRESWETYNILSR